MSKAVDFATRLTSFGTQGPLKKFVENVGEKTSGLVGGGPQPEVPTPGVDNSATAGLNSATEAQNAARAYSTEQERKSAGLAAGSAVTDNQYDALDAVNRVPRTFSARRKLLGA